MLRSKIIEFAKTSHNLVRYWESRHNFKKRVGSFYLSTLAGIVRPNDTQLDDIRPRTVN